MSSDNYVTLIVAKDPEEAEYYQTLLEDHDIDVYVDEDAVDEEGGIAVMVPDDTLEDAQHILEQRDTIDEELDMEYDDEFEDEDEEDEDFDGYEEIDEDEEDDEYYDDEEEEEDDYYEDDSDEYY